MNKLSILILSIFAILYFNSCKEQTIEQKDATLKIKVKLSKITKGHLPDYIAFSGKTVYLNKSNLMSPISGYLTKVNIKQGDVVTKGKLLFEMQSSEAYVMQHKDSLVNKYGTVKVYSPVSGRIVSLNMVNKGIFTDKGSLMCTILATNDLKIQVDVPFEYKELAKIGEKCQIILPDNSKIPGIFSKLLPQVDEASQTVKVMANIKTRQFLPENMKLTIFVDKNKEQQAQLLSKNCLQTDALMTKYWVMKRINDSTAAQTFVNIGTQNHDKVEILSPEFKPDDLFISEGAYGLSDTVLIEITH